MRKKIGLICKNCGTENFLTIDTININPNKIGLNACQDCPKEVRRREFKAIEKRFAKIKRIKSGNIEISTVPYKSNKYKDLKPT